MPSGRAITATPTAAIAIPVMGRGRGQRRRRIASTAALTSGIVATMSDAWEAVVKTSP